MRRSEQGFTFVELPLLMAATCDFAVASAGPSNGAMFPMPSYAHPIVSVACGAAEPPPTTATAATATATSASAAFPTFVISVLLSVPGVPATMLPFL